MNRPSSLPDRVVRDSRRGTWILIVPASEFIGACEAIDRRPDVRAECRTVCIPRSSRPRSLAERALPWVMLAWAVGVWSFLFYDLGHL